jgi:chromosome segregation ATPase
MKKDVNFILLALVIGIMIILVGFTVYYQGTYESLFTQYNEKVNRLEQVTQELGLEKSKVNQTAYQLEIKSERESDLSTKYSSLREENQGLLDDNAKLQKELTENKASLVKTQADLAKSQTLMRQAQDDLTEAQDSISTLRSQKDDLEDDLEQCEATKCVGC